MAPQQAIASIVSSNPSRYNVANPEAMATNIIQPQYTEAPTNYTPADESQMQE
jgi:hypothetical protein